MNRETFRELSIDDQVSYINKLLKEGNSLEASCAKIGLARSSVREKFAKSFYIFDKEMQQYHRTGVIMASDIKHNDESMTREISIDDQSKTSVIKNDDYSMTSHDKPVKESMTDVINQKLLKRIEALELKYNEIIAKIKSDDARMTSVINQSNNSMTGVIKIDDKLKKIVPEESTKDFRTTVRVNNEVWEEFKTFCSKHGEFTQKDLLSQALIEFMKNHK